MDGSSRGEKHTHTHNHNNALCLGKNVDNVTWSLEGCKNSELGLEPLLTSNTVTPNRLSNSNIQSPCARNTSMRHTHSFIHSFILSTNPTSLLCTHTPHMPHNLLPETQETPASAPALRAHVLSRALRRRVALCGCPSQPPHPPIPSSPSHHGLSGFIQEGTSSPSVNSPTHPSGSRTPNFHPFTNSPSSARTCAGQVGAGPQGFVPPPRPRPRAPSAPHAPKAPHAP